MIYCSRRLGVLSPESNSASVHGDLRDLLFSHDCLPEKEGQ